MIGPNFTSIKEWLNESMDAAVDTPPPPQHPTWQGVQVSVALGSAVSSRRVVSEISD